MSSFRRTCAAIFCASLSAISFEVLLLRLFSIALWYHFASMVVSIAMLGMAGSGTVIAVLNTRRKTRAFLKSLHFLVLGLLIPISYLVAANIPFDPVKLSWDRAQLLWICCYYIVLSAPFFASGYIFATAFSSLGEKSGSIYAADLCGAAAGAAGVVLIQMVLRPGQAVFVAASLALLGALFVGGRGLRLILAPAVALSLLAVLKAPEALEPPVSPYKELPVLLRMKGAELLLSRSSPYGRTDLFRSPGVRYAPGLSLRYRGDLPDQLGVSVDGSSVTTATLPAPGDSLDFLDHLPAALAHRLRPGADLFLVDPRGGMPRLLAERSGARTDCSESNPSVVKILEKYGTIVPFPCRETGLARNVIPRLRRSYDLIDIPLTGALPAPHPGGGEDYQLTVEALATYLRALREDGLMNISLYIAPPYRAELRILTTVTAALQELGIKDPRRHLAAFRSLGLLNLLICRRPFRRGEIETIREFASDLWFDPVWYDGMHPREANVFIRSSEADLAAAYSSLVDPETAEKFARGYLFDISPPTDDRPFFHDTLRLATIGQVYELVDGKWDFFITEGYLLPAVFLQVSILGLLLILVPAGSAGRGALISSRAVLFYFALIGTGYMLVEVALIQRLVLPLEHPLTSFAAVVCSLLVSSGVGSYLSGRVHFSWVWKIALAVGLLAPVYILLIGPLSLGLSALTTAARSLAVAFLLFPLGFLMGFPFPGGMRYLASARGQLIPWAWAVNGFFSILAPLLAAMIARKAGFSSVLVLAGLAYLGASLAGRLFCASPTMGTKRTPPI